MPDRKLRIVITVDPEIPVPPRYYGGIERIVDMLVSGLVKRGEEVHLFCHPESKTPAKIIPYRGRQSGSLKDTIRNAWQIKNYIKKIGGVDVVHSFSRLAYLLFILRSPLPKIQSYQRYITPRSVYLGMLVAGETIAFTSCSKFCASTADFMGGRWRVIPNGVVMSKYEFVPVVPANAPLMFLGRIERCKGPHIAIFVAQKTGRQLVIAGNHAERGKEYDYFKQEILPFCDGKQIKYVGAVDDSQKNELLGGAAALLFPIEWGEPFGIVMIEALACGTPVIAFNRGSSAEIVQDGVNGFVCNSREDMTGAVRKIEAIDRKACRRIAEERFSADVVVEEYLNLYQRLVGAAG